MSAEFFWETLVPALNHGLILSLSLILPSAVLGFVCGVLVGVVRVFAARPFRRLADGYVALFRGVPLLLQLYFLYNALPVVGVRLTAYEAAVLGFILCSAAYQSEYVRGALLSIRQGQIRAAWALGFTTPGMVFHVVIPQAVRRALPGCGNEIIYLIKYSSLAYMLTYIELTGTAFELANHSLRHVEVYLTAGLYYLAINTLATWLLRRFEQKTAVPGFGALA